VPVILPTELEEATVSAEVEADEAISFPLPYPPELMRAVSACSLVNSVRNDHPRRLEPGTAAEAAAA
jgi:putative SOS response-associated peptidase YedK